MSGINFGHVLKRLLVCFCALAALALADIAAAQPSGCSFSIVPNQVPQGGSTKATVTCASAPQGLDVSLSCPYPSQSSVCFFGSINGNTVRGSYDLSSFPQGTFTLNAQVCDRGSGGGGGGPACAASFLTTTVTITAPPPPISCTLTATPAQLPAGGGLVTLDTSCLVGFYPIVQYAWTGPGAVPVTKTGSQQVNVTATSSYTVKATDSIGEVSNIAFTTVTVAGGAAPSGCTLTATPPQVPPGGALVTLTAACSGGGAPSSYTWSGPGVTPTTTAPTQQVNVTGPATFSVVGVNSAGSSAPASASVTVSGAGITLAPPTLPPASFGVPYSQLITASGGTAPYTFSVTAGALPAGLTLSPQGLLSGTPATTGTTTKAAGTSTFTITASDSAQRSGSQSYTLVVSTATGTLQIVSGDKQVAPPNTPLPQSFVARVVDSQGNPVAGATVNWAVGQGGGTITIQTNTSNPQGQVLASYTTGPAQINNTVIATVAGSGSSVTFTVLNQQTNVTIPAQQVITPQGQMAFNAPIIQLNNIRQHLDHIRMSNSPTVADGLRMSYDGQALPPMSVFAVAPLDKDGKPQPQTGGGAAADKPDEFQRWGFFINGDVDIGRQSSVDTQTGFKATTHGLTAGVDYRFANNSVLGAAIGYLKTDTDLDSGAGNQNAKGYSFSLYGTYVPVVNAYIDGIVNFGHNKYDGQRQAGANTFGNNTDGNQWGLAVSAGYAFNKGPLAFTPYGRVEYVDAKVNGFTESGPAGALAIGNQELKGTTLTLGGQASYAISTSWGVLIPNGRVEFQHLAQRSGSDVSAQLVGVASPSVGIPILGSDRNFGNFAVGFSATFQRGVSAFFNYQRLFGKSDYSDQLYTLGLRFEF